MCDLSKQPGFNLTELPETAEHLSGAAKQTDGDVDPPNHR